MKQTALRYLHLIFLGAVLLLSACEKDEINIERQTPITPDTSVTRISPVASRMLSNGDEPMMSRNGGLLVECLTINFPFGFIIDSTTYTISSAQDFETVLNANIDEFTFFVDFAYPLAITLEDGSSATANNSEELSQLVADCVPNHGWGNGAFPAFFFDDPNCVSLSYPVNLLTGDGISVSAATANDLVSLLASNQLFFDFPIQVIDTLGLPLTVNDAEQLFGILAACACPGNGGGHGSGGIPFTGIFGEDCFTVVYPINVQLLSGGTSSVNNDDELFNLILNGQFIDLVYPFSVALVADGSVVTVDSEQELEAIWFNCSGPGAYDLSGMIFISNDVVINCYEIIYPYTVIDAAGDTVVIDNQGEALSYFNRNEETRVLLPVNIIQNGVAINVNSVEQYLDIQDACSQSNEGVSGLFLALGITGASCFQFEYPLTILELDGSVTILYSDTDARVYLQNGGGNGNFEYPLNVILTQRGLSFSVTSDEAFFDLVSNCQ